MNRRAFLTAVAAVPLAVIAFPRELSRPSHVLTYRGAPFVFDAECLSNRIYFVNRELCSFDGRGVMRHGLSVRTP